jgi:hypothetical protein
VPKRDVDSETIQAALVRNTTTRRIMATSAPYEQHHHLRADHTTALSMLGTLWPRPHPPYNSTTCVQITPTPHHSNGRPMLGTSWPRPHPHHLRADHTHTTAWPTDAGHIMTTPLPRTTDTCCAGCIKYQWVPEKRVEAARQMCCLRNDNTHVHQPQQDWWVEVATARNH